MMDGWLARYREDKWGRKSASPDERVGWHEVKSAEMFRLSQVAEVNKGRRILTVRHVVAIPAQTDPVDFVRKVQDEAVWMGSEQGEEGVCDNGRRRLPLECVRGTGSRTSRLGNSTYRTVRGEGVPIGSGAMESQCPQKQNQFKHRGQFWSKAGFASFLAVYVWYTNGELDVIYRQAA